MHFPTLLAVAHWARMETEDPLYQTILRHLLTVAGFIMAVLLIARLMSEKRQPGTTMAWLLVIAFVPYVGVPLYLLLGGRKLKRLARRKSRLCPVPTASTAPFSPAAAGATAQTLVLDGVCPPFGGKTLHFLTRASD